MFVLFTLLLFSVAVVGLAFDDEGAHTAVEPSVIEPVEEMSDVLGNDGFDVAASSSECDGICDVGVVFMQ